MTKFIVSFAAAALLATPALAAPDAAAPAASPNQYSFTQDGLTYHVTERDMGGYRLISGRDSIGRAFNFRVAGDRVSGEYGGDTMEFATPQDRRAQQVATR